MKITGGRKSCWTGHLRHINVENFERNVTFIWSEITNKRSTGLVKTNSSHLSYFETFLSDNPPSPSVDWGMVS